MSKGMEVGGKMVAELQQQAIDVGRALVGRVPQMKEEGINIEVADGGVELYRGEVIAVIYSVFCHGELREDLADMAAQQLESEGYLAINAGRGQVKLILSEEAVRQAVEGTAMIRQAVEVVRGWQERHRSGAVDVDGANARAMLEGWGAGGAQEQEPGPDEIVQQVRSETSGDTYKEPWSFCW